MARSSPASVRIGNCLSPSWKSANNSAPSQTVAAFGNHTRAPCYIAATKHHTQNESKKEGERKKQSNAKQQLTYNTFVKVNWVGIDIATKHERRKHTLVSMSNKNECVTRKNKKNDRETKSTMNIILHRETAQKLLMWPRASMEMLTFNCIVLNFFTYHCNIELWFNTTNIHTKTLAHWWIWFGFQEFILCCVCFFSLSLLVWSQKKHQVNDKKYNVWK